jgi:UPF0271 protein
LRIDLNADLGESFGAYALGDDARLLQAVTSANLAAGFHAGDPTVLRRTLALAKAAAVAVGAHPSFPDLVGFGRREMRIDEHELEDLVLYQIAAVAGVAQATGLRLQHVKPHGALYNMAATNLALAGAIARAVVAFDPALILFGPAGSILIEAGRQSGLRVACEVFADRAYEADGTLVSRAKPGAVIDDPEIIVARVVRMIREGVVVARDGSHVTVDPDTICLHGDTPGAAALGGRIRAGLDEAGIVVRAVGVA